MSKNTLTHIFDNIIAKNTVSGYIDNMAHNRKRHVFAAFQKLLGFSPIIGVFGHRQVGKSTFIASSVKEYTTLDDVDLLDQAHSDPKNFINSRAAPFAIDECQMEPKLFPTLKEWVRKNKRAGQFVLSGSVRFTSRKAIRESLAGRISLLEMLPFSVAEISDEPLSEPIVQLLSHRIFSSDSERCLHHSQQAAKFKKNFGLYLENGGLPGICFIRNAELKKSALNDLHDLMLGRDLRLVSDLKTPIATIKKWMSYVSSLAFEPYNASEVKRLMGLAPQTQKSLIHALESIFLIRRIPVPLRKKEIIVLEDQFEELVYSKDSLSEVKRLETAVYRNLRNQFAYRLDKDVIFESYLTRDGARVPIVIKSGLNTLGIIVSAFEKPALSETRSAASFLRNHVNAKVLYLSNESIKSEILDERSMLCSIYSII